MNKTDSRDQQAGRPAEVAATAEAGAVPRRGGVRWAIAGLAIVLAAGGAAAAWGAGAFHSAASSAGGQGAPAPATRPVKRQDLSSVKPASATPGDARSYSVPGPGRGAPPRPPAPGRRLRPGSAVHANHTLDAVGPL